ncbi:MAG: hypothetical protein IPM47_18830 [Sphingobacteriales bacterium]|nr:MAG: hypothetical protein IPM47_18830 [Sphingobacteriales bacterium]
MCDVFAGHKIVWQTAVKPHNDIADNGQERPNEDYARYKQSSDGNAYILGLSDGAGGYGVFTSEWAKALVQQLPEKPLISATDIDDWLNGWWESFYNKAEGNLPSNETFLKNKFYNEGSAATLCALWLFENKEGGSPCWNYLCVGDSVIFRYNVSNGQLETPKHFQTPEQWEALPNLLNWANQETIDLQISADSGSLLPDDCWILASDALAQWIWVQYLLSEANEKNRIWLENARQCGGRLGRIIETVSQTESRPRFSEWFGILMQAARDPKNFERLLYDAYEQRCLLRDDYTLLVLYPSTMVITKKTN